MEEGGRPGEADAYGVGAAVLTPGELCTWAGLPAAPPTPTPPPCAIAPIGRTPGLAMFVLPPGGETAAAATALAAVPDGDASARLLLALVGVAPAPAAVPPTVPCARGEEAGDAPCPLRPLSVCSTNAVRLPRPLPAWPGVVWGPVGCAARLRSASSDLTVRGVEVAPAGAGE